MKEHYLLKTLENPTEKYKWIFNHIFHMLEMFDKKNQITDIIVEETEGFNGQIKTTEDTFYRYKKYKTISKTLFLRKALVDECWKDQQEDSTITLNYIFLIVLHELCHLKFHRHSKRFARHFANITYRYLAFIENKTIKEIKKNDNYNLYKWIKKDTRKQLLLQGE